MTLNRTREDINLKESHVFTTVFDRFYIPLCLFAEKFVDSPEQANDIVQDCFVKLWQLRSDFCYLHQVKSFLYTAVRNKALNEVEHRMVVQEYAQSLIHKESEAFFYNQVIEEETYRILHETVESLPTQTKAVIKCSLEGLSNKEIAVNLAISTETVHTLKKIAYSKLRKSLREHYYLLLFYL